MKFKKNSNINDKNINKHITNKKIRREYIKKYKNNQQENSQKITWDLQKRSQTFHKIINNKIHN